MPDFSQPIRSEAAISRIPSRGWDGRWLIAATTLACFLFVVASTVFALFPTAWSWFGVDHLTPPFIDLRAVATGMDSHRAGYDPLVHNAHDPLGRALNYPRIWLLLGRVGFSERHTVPAALCLIAAFYASVLMLVGRVNVAGGVVYSLLICSPAVMLGVERGNIDLFIFTLLSAAAAVLGKPRWNRVGYLGIAIAAILKLFPIFALAVVTRERMRRGIIVAVALASAFALYLFLIGGDLALVLNSTQQGAYISYGRGVLFERLRDYGLQLNPQLVSAAAVGVVISGAAAVALRWRGMLSFDVAVGEKLLIGAAIYAGTFMLLNNFNYRLIFALLMIPQMLKWLGRDRQMRRVSIFGLAVLTAVLLCSAQLGRWQFLFKESANWLLFALTIFLLVQAVAQWPTTSGDPTATAPHARGEKDASVAGSFG